MGPLLNQRKRRRSQPAIVGLCKRRDCTADFGPFIHKTAQHELELRACELHLTKKIPMNGSRTHSGAKFQAKKNKEDLGGERDHKLTHLKKNIKRVALRGPHKREARFARIQAPQTGGPVILLISKKNCIR